LIVQGPAVIYGVGGVTIMADRAAVQGPILCGSGGQLNVGNDATGGDLFSLSPIRLYDRSTVGWIQTSAALTLGSNDHYRGLLKSTPVLPAFPQISTQFTGTKAITLQPDAKQTITPGQYARVTVNSRAQLTLSTGSYNFTALDLEPQAKLIVPSTSETVKIYVRDTVIYRGTATISGGTAAPVYLGYVGTSPLVLESVYTGTVVAPNAQLTLQTVTGGYTGEFFGKQVVVAAQTTVKSNPYTCK
jgi:hypothetical protein